MSLIAVVEKVIVENKKLLTHNQILEGVTLASLLPGPVAVNTIAHVGYRIMGVRGVVICTVAVTLPSFFLVLIISHFYFHYGQQFELLNVFMAINPAVAAIIISVAVKMYQRNAENIKERILIFLSFFLMLFGQESFSFLAPFIIILVYGIVGYLYFSNQKNNKSSELIKSPKNVLKLVFPFILFISLFLIISVFDFPIKNDSILKLSTVFSGLSLMLFGGGYVFIPMMQDLIVDHYGWLSDRQFIDGIAIGQMTPGPIVITVAFIGYKLQGFFGALISTISIFTPPIITMVFATRIMDYLKQSAKVLAILKGIKLGIIGMIIFAGYSIMKDTLIGSTGDIIHQIELVGVLVISFFLLHSVNISVVWIVLGAGLIGYFIF